jgi:hypothetical protein
MGIPSPTRPFAVVRQRNDSRQRARLRVRTSIGRDLGEFRVVLRNPAGLSLSVPNVFTFTINDNEHGYSIERSPGQGAFFQETRLVVRENSGETLVNILSIVCGCAALGRLADCCVRPVEQLA